MTVTFSDTRKGKIFVVDNVTKLQRLPHYKGLVWTCTMKDGEKIFYPFPRYNVEMVEEGNIK